MALDKTPLYIEFYGDLASSSVFELTKHQALPPLSNTLIFYHVESITAHELRSHLPVTTTFCAPSLRSRLAASSEGAKCRAAMEDRSWRLISSGNGEYAR